MPQTNLYFFNSISLIVLIGYLVGYSLFYRYLVGRLMFVFSTRNYLTQLTSQRINPLKAASFWCPMLVKADFIYLEGFLFSVEFLILLYLVVYFGSQNLQPQTINLTFNLLTTKNNSKTDQLQLIQTNTNLLRLFNRNRTHLFVGVATDELNELSIKILTQLFQPYNNQFWLVKVIESFLVSLKQTATDELKNEQLAHE